MIWTGLGWRDPKGQLVPKQDHGVQGLILLDRRRRTPGLGLCISKCPSKGSVTIVTHNEGDLLWRLGRGFIPSDHLQSRQGHF